MRTKLLAMSCVVILLTSAMQLPASAIMRSTSAVEWDPAPVRDSLDDLTLTLSGLPTKVSSDLTVSFRLRADLYFSESNVSLSIDGFPLGIWLNDNVTDDVIEDTLGELYSDTPPDSAKIRSTNDDPSPGFSSHTLSGTAVIERELFAALVADSELEALFDFSPEVTDYAFPQIYPWAFPEFAEFAVSYESAGAVPEPATFVIWAILGMCGVGAEFWRHRRENAA